MIESLALRVTVNRAWSALDHANEFKKASNLHNQTCGVCRALDGDADTAHERLGSWRVGQSAMA